MDTLDDILDEGPAEPAVEAVAEPVEPVIAAAPEAKADDVPRDEKGKFAAKGEEKDASPAPVEEPPYEHAAVKGERERRQAAEKRAQELEAQIQAFQAPKKTLSLSGKMMPNGRNNSELRLSVRLSRRLRKTRS